MIDLSLLKHALKCECPKCHSASIFPHRFTLNVRETCPHCGLDLKDHDSGDGAVVFLIFVLSFLLTPLALILNAVMDIPLWGHAVLWTAVAFFICFFTMQQLKAYIIALAYKHRGGAKGV